MDYTKLDLQTCFNLACTEFGLEDTHSLAIGRLIELVANGYLTEAEATDMARIIYHHGSETLYYNDDWYDYEEEEPDENGFDPYMGCYTGDC